MEPSTANVLVPVRRYVGEQAVKLVMDYDLNHSRSVDIFLYIAYRETGCDAIQLFLTRMALSCYHRNIFIISLKQLKSASTRREKISRKILVVETDNHTLVKYFLKFRRLTIC